jgi:hypothetical protein
LLTIATLLRLEGEGWSAILSLALAMGVANAAIAGRDGSVIGVTHMTGTLVQMGQKIANAVRGDGDRRWLDHLGLWAALVGGALLGARAVIWSPPWPMHSPLRWPQCWRCVRAGSSAMSGCGWPSDLHGTVRCIRRSCRTTRFSQRVLRSCHTGLKGRKIFFL